MNTERISPIQLASMLVIQRCLIMLALLPVVLFTPGVRDAWLASLVGGLIAMIPVYLAWQVMALQPGRDLVEICEICLGRFVGKLVAVLYLGFFAINAAVVLRQFGEFLATAPLPETPIEVFLFMMAVGTAYTLRRGIEVIARVSHLLIIPLIAFTLVIMVLSVKDLEPERILPVLGDGFGPVVVGSLEVGALWVEAFIISMLAPHLSDFRLAFRYSLGAIAVGSVWLALSALVVTMFFSGPEAKAQTFPLYVLMRSISVGDFLERMDPFFIVTWTSASLLKLTLLSYVSCNMVAQLLGLADYRRLALPMGFLGAVIALTQFESVADLRALNEPRVFILMVLPFGILLPLLLVVVGRLRALRSGCP